MSLRCDNCRKGVLRGNMVSHAKNRLKRIFKPNLHKLKVFRQGHEVSVRFCTRCIKRLRNYNFIGEFMLKKPELALRPVLNIEKKKPVEVKIQKTEKHQEIKKTEEKINIDALVGKKS